MWEPYETLFCPCDVGDYGELTIRTRRRFHCTSTLLLSHELVWHLAVRYQGDATNHKNNRVPCREFATYRLYITTRTYPLLNRAQRLFLREVPTLSKGECLACPGRREPTAWLLHYYYYIIIIPHHNGLVSPALVKCFVPTSCVALVLYKKIKSLIIVRTEFDLLLT